MYYGTHMGWLGLRVPRCAVPPAPGTDQARTSRAMTSVMISFVPPPMPRMRLSR
jgi:hypothetical protein